MFTRQSYCAVMPFLAALTLGCSDGSNNGDSASRPPAVPFQALYDQGVDRYLGQFTPMTSDARDGGEIRYTFGTGDGPLCFTGNAFEMSTRDGASEELLIFLQGGGACSETNCAAVPSPFPVIPAGILNPADPANPAADFDLGYVPYCDGTFFTGDRDVDSDGDGSNDRFFRGIQNLSAALDIIANTYPSPPRILLAGNSAGGFGVHYALPLVRKLYPDVPIELINDSGMGIGQPGGQQRLIDYWNSGAFIPDDCVDCIGDDGNLTGYHSYQLAEDSNLRMGFISSTADEVVTARGIDPAEFGPQLVQAVAQLENTYPDRFRSAISTTDEHTYIIKQFDFGIGGTTVRQWVTAMLDGGDQWVSVSD